MGEPVPDYVLTERQVEAVRAIVREELTKHDQAVGEALRAVADEVQADLKAS